MQSLIWFPDWFPTKQGLAVKLQLLSDAGGFCGYFPDSSTSWSAFLAWHNPENFLRVWAEIWASCGHALLATCAHLWERGWFFFHPGLQFHKGPVRPLDVPTCTSPWTLGRPWAETWWCPPSPAGKGPYSAEWRSGEKAGPCSPVSRAAAWTGAGLPPALTPNRAEQETLRHGLSQEPRGTRASSCSPQTRP